MSDDLLLSFCRAIQAEHDGKPCPKCNHNGHADFLADLAYANIPRLKCDCVDGKAPPAGAIVYIAADWLEEQGDPRAEALRELRIGQYDDGGVIPDHWWVEPQEGQTTLHRTHADATRELLRRALDILTVPCGCKVVVTGQPARRVEVSGRPQRRIEPAEFAEAIGAERIACGCDGRGWLPARAVQCEACGGTGEADNAQFSCRHCKGQGWIKQPLQAAKEVG